MLVAFGEAGLTREQERTDACKMKIGEDKC